MFVSLLRKQTNDYGYVCVCLNFVERGFKVNDVLFFLMPLSIAVVVFVLVWTTEKVTQDCWHSWDNWTQNTNDGVFTQARQCTKCGYVEMEQTKNMKGFKENE